MQIKTNTIEERVIRILMEKYPITVEELQHALKISMNIIKRVLKKFQVHGIIVLEQLPDKTYIRLLRNNFEFIGRKLTQKKPLKKSKGGKEVKEYDGMMYV